MDLDGVSMENKAILIIEDEEINRILLTNMLKEEYKILEARDGQEGLDIDRKSVV